MLENKQLVIRCRGIIIHNDKLLVVKMGENEHYAFPGGHLEWGEDIKECLSRELIEELGIKPEIGRLLYVSSFIEKEIKHSIEFMFEITNGEDYLDLDSLERTHSHELSEIYWASSDEDIFLLPKKIAEDFRDSKILSDITRSLKD